MAANGHDSHGSQHAVAATYSLRKFMQAQHQRYKLVEGDHEHLLVTVLQSHFQHCSTVPQQFALLDNCECLVCYPQGICQTARQAQ